MSGASLAVKAVAERENVPMLEGVAGSDALTQPGDVYIYRVVPNNSKQAKGGVTYIVKKLKLKKEFENQIVLIEDGERSQPFALRI